MTPKHIFLHFACAGADDLLCDAMQSAFSISTPTVNACTLLCESNKQTFALLHFPLGKLFSPSGAGCASWCAAIAPGQIKSDPSGQQCSLPTRRRLARIMRTKKKNKVYN